jgi:pyruvate/2-oxoglutarate dehydrogenase complex dihydrolipoamide acyltransferase (E2) component
MATPIYVPRINNNDDEVKILGYEVITGSKVAADQIIGQIETDKAVMDVTAPEAGYVLGLVGLAEEVVKVGSIMLWIGNSPDEEIPEVKEEAGQPGAGRTSQITAKARLLINRHRLNSDAIPPIDGRLTVEAVERFMAERGMNRATQVENRAVADRPADVGPSVAGAAVDLSREEKGMAATVSWHRDFAVPGYIEIEYEVAPWVEYAKRFQEEKGLLMPPLLPLMAWRLIQVAREMPRINATFVANKRYEYEPLNLGFTIQAGEALYLAVVREAHQMDELGFVNALGDVLRRAAGHNLKEAETNGATIGFSSMERWKVTRHIPILPPHTSFMAAHAAGRDGRAVLGASYDHRVLNGGQVVAALKKIATPAKIY